VTATLSNDDLDGDGLPDGFENGYRDGFGNWHAPDSSLIDTDGDGLSDRYEAGELGTEVDSGYEDIIYTQDVIIEFKNNQRAYVFDPDMLCTADMIGTTKEIALGMLVHSLEKTGTSAVNIKPHPSRYFIDIEGCISEIIVPDDPQKAKRWHNAIVNFGLGKVLINIDKKYFHLHLKAGDCVRVDGRVDLWDIE
jgi:hypothetical protein